MLRIATVSGPCKEQQRELIDNLAEAFEIDKILLNDMEKWAIDLSELKKKGLSLLKR
ncbi:MAG: hypothetical protein GY816_04775 [Cytophagales bacterium]|nr:hypothetical protein [Cytophagales bacterium]